MSPMFDAPLHSSDQSIDRVLNAGLPVLLVFFDRTVPADFDTVMKTLAKQQAGSLLVVQTSLQDSPQAAQRFGVRAAPGVVGVRNGAAQSQADAVLAADLERHARYLLGRGPRPEPVKPGETYAASDRPSPSSPPPAGRPLNITDATFDQEVLRSSLPVVVDFWAPWCGPCRMVAPILDRLAGEWAGRVKIVKMNVDENPRTAGLYGVQAIPTMMVVKDGRIIDQWAGALPEPALRSRLAQLVR